MEAKDINNMKEAIKEKYLALLDPNEESENFSENNSPVIEKKVSSVTLYDKRKISFEKWSNDSGVDLESYSKKIVFDLLTKAHSSEKLWKIGFSTYQRDFYQPYSREIGLKKSSGAPPRRK